MYHINRIVHNYLVMIYFKNNIQRHICTSAVKYTHEKEDKQHIKDLKKEVMRMVDFSKSKTKNKSTFLEVIQLYNYKSSVYRRGQVEFIYAALKHMREFNVHKDIRVYKELVRVMPEGKYVPQSVWQMEMMYYPKHQHCILDLLEQMEDNGVQPDFEIQTLLTARFGKWGYPLRKLYRMTYWMGKFKNASPWPLPRPLPPHYTNIAKLAIDRISHVDLQRKVTQYYTKTIEDALDETWVLSSQSPMQKDLLKKHDRTKPLFVEGPFRTWVREASVNYFLLRANPIPIEPEYEDLDDVGHFTVPTVKFKPPQREYLKNMPSAHEQEDGVIMAICSTGTSSKDSLLSWIRLLEKDGNPALSEIPIVFSLKRGEESLAKLSTENKENSDEKSEQSVES